MAASPTISFNDDTSLNSVEAYQEDLGREASAIPEDVLLLRIASQSNGQDTEASLSWIFDDNGLGNLDPATLANADGIGLGIASFSFDFDVPNFGIVPFQFDIDINDITFTEGAVAVPTPAALGGAALLIPMLLKRRRNS